MTNILKAENINFGYNNKKLIKNINFELKSSEVIGLFGNSGTGKSTFSKILAGLITDYEGLITINNNKINSKFYPIQLINQHPEKAINPKWTMNKVLKESWDVPSELLNQFNIKYEWLDRSPSELSGGQLQRFNILRALNPKTKFIIADEMTTMLDTVSQAQIWYFFLNYTKNNNIGVLVISHDTKLLDRIADKITHFDRINNYL